MLSIDPSSPFTRGALLGDRIRLSDHFLDPGVFIRSMATPRRARRPLRGDAAGGAADGRRPARTTSFIETVGVGQAEIDIVDHADTIVLALMPGSGDSIQALKAGVMEIPDVIVVNKADHPMTDTMVREIRGVLALGPPERLEGADPADRGGRGARGSRSSPRRSTSTARTSRRRARSSERRARNLRNEVLGIAASRMRRRLEAAVADDPAIARAARPRRQARARPGERRRASCCERETMAETRGRRAASLRGRRGAAGIGTGSTSSAARPSAGSPAIHRRRRRRRARAGSLIRARAASAGCTRDPVRATCAEGGGRVWAALRARLDPQGPDGRARRGR